MGRRMFICSRSQVLARSPRVNRRSVSSCVRAELLGGLPQRSAHPALTRVQPAAESPGSQRVPGGLSGLAPACPGRVLYRRDTREALASGSRLLPPVWFGLKSRGLPGARSRRPRARGRLPRHLLPVVPPRLLRPFSRLRARCLLVSSPLTRMVSTGEEVCPSVSPPSLNSESIIQALVGWRPTEPDAAAVAVAAILDVRPRAAMPPALGEPPALVGIVLD
uniref:Uncharacterized protein n=1 Tax=Rangifer tarandus platyrhynchus TaxID=3082113 RepID=A0ACB0FIP1_RANTA|nr:unnamed protein product [Rangifer tarandus platyrhynchus]